MLENLYRILNVIIEKRKDFFDAKNPSEAEQLLKMTPLKRKDIADICSLDPSLVTRHSEKTVYTQHGLFKLHDFFVRPSRLKKNLPVSELSKLVEDLINEWDKKGQPISDKKIAELLTNREGINISQRYVTKIRNDLGIPTFGRR